MKAIEGPIVDGVGLGYPGFFALPGQVSIELRPCVIVDFQSFSYTGLRYTVLLAGYGRAAGSPLLLCFDMLSHGCCCCCLFDVLLLLLPQALESEAAWSRFVRGGRVQLRCEVTDCE